MRILLILQRKIITKNYNKDKDIKNANNENSIKEFDIYSPKR